MVDARPRCPPSPPRAAHLHRREYVRNAHSRTELPPRRIQGRTDAGISARLGSAARRPPPRRRRIQGRTGAGISASLGSAARRPPPTRGSLPSGPRRQPNQLFVGTQPRGRGCYRRSTERTKGIQRGPVPLRAVVRTRFLRVRVRVRHRRPAFPRDRARRAHRARQPGAPRGQRVGAEHGGRRGGPDPGPLRLPGRGCRGAGAPAASRAGVRRRHALPAAR